MITNGKQRNAITQLKRAITACAKAKVGIFGMDNVLYATVSHDHGKDFHENYQLSGSVGR